MTGPDTDPDLDYFDDGDGGKWDDPPPPWAEPVAAIVLTLYAAAVAAIVYLF